MKKIMLDESRPTRKKESVLKEAKLLSRLKHPHIVTCRSFFFDEFDDHLCIIQDFCDDGTIFDKIRLEQVSLLDSFCLCRFSHQIPIL